MIKKKAQERVRASRNYAIRRRVKAREHALIKRQGARERTRRQKVCDKKTRKGKRTRIDQEKWHQRDEKKTPPEVHR